MKKIMIILFVFLFVGSAYGEMFYYKKMDKDGFRGLRAISCMQIETANLIKISESEFQALKEIMDSAPPTEAEINREKINNKMKEIAIEFLITEGKLPPEYK